MDYIVFYNSVEDFINKTDAKQNISIIGLDEKEVNLLEKQCSVRLPVYLKEYLSQFGVEFSFYSRAIHEYFFSSKSILKSIELFSQYELDRILQALMGDVYLNFIPLYYDEMRSQMIFLDSTSSYGYMIRVSELYLGDNNEVYDPEDIEATPYLDFAENLQERLFLEIKYAFYPNRKSDYIDLTSIGWAKFHMHYHKYKHSSYDIGFTRKEFSKKIKNDVDSVVSFEEYEVLFIKYLIQEKGVPPIPEIYDPYDS